MCYTCSDFFGLFVFLFSFCFLFFVGGVFMLDLSGVSIKGRFLCVRKSVGSDGREYFYGDFLTRGKSKHGVTSVRLKDPHCLDDMMPNDEVDILVDIQEIRLKNGGVFMAVDFHKNGNV